MRILSCHIENFGKISNQDFCFTDGFNGICKENGWGKSTLATFIKVMFFGFADEGKRDELANERKHYKPWQGGVYGGGLVFVSKGKNYQMTRTFGTKSKEDVFVLRDAETNLESSDFTSNIGEELFQIDHDSFCRTIYISQNDCETASTDGIHAKIGNLAENTNDINNYETVMKKLNDKLNEMSPTRKTGSINRRMEQVYELENRVKRIPEIEEAMRICTEKRDEEKKQKGALKAAQEEIQTELKRMSASKDIQVKQERYQALCKQLQEAKEKLERSRSFFPGKVPEQEEVLAMNRNASRLSKLRLDSAKARFSTEDEAKLEKLDDLFQHGIPEMEEIDHILSMWNTRNEKKSVLHTKKATADTLESVANAADSQKKKPNILILAVGIVLILAGAAGCLLNLAAGLVGAVLGLILIILGATVFAKTAGMNPETLQKQENLRRMREEIEADEQFIADAEQRVNSFRQQYGMVCQEHEIINRFYALKTQIGEYEVLSHQKTRYEETNAEKEIEELSRGIQDFLTAFYPDQDTSSENAFEALQEIRTHLQSLHENKDAYDMICQNKEKFEAENDIQQLQHAEMVHEGAFEKMNQELAKITEVLETVITHISDYDKRLDLLQQEREDIGEEEEQLVHLKEEVELDKIRYEQLTLTRGYLEKSKESFTAKYRTPIKESFEKYYEILTKQSAELYQIDANINLTVMEQGLQRNVGLLSTGYRDLTGVCMRMALVDAMYQEEKPFVIFDDPFTNLDQEKTKGGLELLHKIAEEYQVIYYTCHD